MEITSYEMNQQLEVIATPLKFSSKDHFEKSCDFKNPFKDGEIEIITQKVHKYVEFKSVETNKSVKLQFSREPRHNQSSYSS